MDIHSANNKMDTFVTGPAIAYGMVYEMNKDGYLYALDIQTGRFGLEV